MSKTGSFVVWCIERYRFHKHLSGSQAARLFDEHGVFAYLEKHSDALHTTGEEYIVQDIESYIASTSC